jgi:beta-galactosidase
MFAGKPAITRYRYGDGQVIYIGMFSNARFYESLAGWMLSESRVKAPLTTAPGVEMTERWQGDKRLLFLLNHNMQSRPVRLNSEFMELISGKLVSGTVQLAPRDVMILKLPPG